MTSDVVPTGSSEGRAADVADGATEGAETEVATSPMSESVTERTETSETPDAAPGEEDVIGGSESTDEITEPSAIVNSDASVATRSVEFSAQPSDADETTGPTTKDDELWSPEESELAATTVPAADVSRAHLKGLIEALVFVSDQPLSINDIAKAAGRAERKLVKTLADELRQEYARRGIHLDEVAGGLIFRTNPAYGPFIRDAAAKKPVRMTRAQLETLAIIAYRQPLTRPEVDEVRGVDSGPVMKMLLERDLIKILGKKDEPGRPLLYGTTHVFLEFFGLKALKDLPSLREFTELSDDSRRTYDREMADSPDAPANLDLTTLAVAASAAVPAEAREAISDGEAEPPTVRPAEGVPGDWFEHPTQPDATVDDLGMTSLEADGTVASEADGAHFDDAASDDAESDVSGARSDADENPDEPEAQA